MKIRAAVRDDIPRLVALERQAESAAHWGEQHYRALFPAGECQPGAPQRLCLVVEVTPEQSSAGQSGPAAQLRVEGFIVAQVVDGECEIENLVVAAASRRRGLASRLLEQLLRLALDQGAKMIALEVRESNQAARSLYAKWGFREVARRRGYYRDPPEAAVLLHLAAAPPAQGATLSGNQRSGSFVKNG